MADIKRNISQVGDSDLQNFDGKKLHAKPGRKPVDTEPKSKRTAQNRAAQRAYRERKERKMQDLEDKVKLLEDENIKAATETDFLRAQVEILKVELSRYRSETNVSDLMLPTKVGKLTNPVTGGYVPNFDNSLSSSNSSNKSDRLSLSGSVDNTSPLDNTTAEFPWYQKNLPNRLNANSSSNTTGSNNTSPLNDNLLISPDSSVGVGGNTPHRSIANELDFSSFEEQVDPFCMKLNEACGTKECPVPKCKRDSSSASNDINSVNSSVLNTFPKGSIDIQQYTSPFSNLVSPNSNNANFINDPFFIENGEDPLSFLNNNNFDIDLAFSNKQVDLPKQDDFDPIALLTTEESIYDRTTNNKEVDMNFNFNEFVKSSLETPKDSSKVKEDDDDADVVPAPPSVMKCSEIWDRISSHPRYSEIDIDGLCNELKSKAKCSERGVVINSSDVNYLIEQSAMLKRDL